MAFTEPVPSTVTWAAPRTVALAAVTCTGGTVTFTGETVTLTGAAEATDDTSGPAAGIAEPDTAVNPDLTAGTTGPLVTARVTACSAFPVPLTAVTAAGLVPGPRNTPGRRPASDRSPRTGSQRSPRTG